MSEHEHIPGTTDEHRLLSKMTTPEGMADVVKSGVRSDIFEDDLHRFVFDWMLDYRAERKSTPTLHVLETEFPRLQLPLPTDVEEATDWLIETLRKRFKINRLQKIMDRALDITDEDPDEAMERIYQDAAEARRVAPSESSVLDRLSHNGAWLDAQEFTPLEYAVDGIIPEGLGLLVAPPKKGKSWLVGNVGLAVASGGLALGAIRVIQRPVLYLALEDGHKRLQNRFRRMLADGPIPEGIEVVTRATPAEAMAAIAEFMERHASEKPPPAIVTRLAAMPSAVVRRGVSRCVGNSSGSSWSSAQA